MIHTNLKKAYIAPQTEVVLLDENPVMVKASPGVGSEWQEGDPIEAKEFSAIDYLPKEFRNMWDE